MTAAQRYCILDYETRSEADLKKVGSYDYARDPSTEIICLGYRFGTRETLRDAPVHLWEPLRLGEFAPDDLLAAIRDPNVMFVAHNALFEQVITRYVLAEYYGFERINMPIERWICTAALAAALSLPRRLEDVGAAIGTKVEKDMTGHRLMLRCSKPKRPSKKDPSKWDTDPDKLRRVGEYCRDDIEVETELFLRLRPLSPTERRVWCLDQQMNQTGIAIDRATVAGAQAIAAEAGRRYTAELAAITDGEIKTTGQVAAIRDYLADRCGLEIESLAAPVIRETLERDDLLPKARRILEVRQLAGKTSTKKLAAFDLRSRVDGRIRDILLYHGAATGRWSGAGVQVQNLPRGTMTPNDGIFEALRAGDIGGVEFYGEPLEVISSALRGFIVPTAGREFFAGDWSAIEARVAAWLAGQDDMLADFADGRPIYEGMASKIYRVPIDRVDGYQRQVGKFACLGLQYGMGKDKFQVTGKDQFGIEISPELAERAVATYRDVNAKIVEAWHTLERGAIAAVLNPTKRYKVCRVIWGMAGKFLACELPSGRKMYYYGPEVRMKKTPWGEPRRTLYHYTVNTMTRKWNLEGTYGGKLLENVTQAASRDVMADAMLRLEGTPYRPVFTVHDEIVAEGPKGGNLDDFSETIARSPDWADGLPLAVGCWRGDRYKKD